MTAAAKARAVPEVDRNLAFLIYGLLFFSIFFAGVPALIAVAIAYARKRDADPLLKGHHGFQILIFWVGFALALLAGAAGLGAILTAIGHALGQASDENWQGWRALRIGEIVSPMALVFAVLFCLLASAGAIWLAVTSVYGAVRLASISPIRQ